MPIPKMFLDLLMDAREDAAIRRAPTGSRGTQGTPADPRRYEDIEQGVAQSGYSDSPLDPELLQRAQAYGVAPHELIVQRNAAVQRRVSDDVIESMGGKRLLNPAPGGQGRPDVTVPTPDALGYQGPTRAPWQLIPEGGNETDERVMENRTWGRPGYVAEDFGGLSHGEAAALIADQLKARRIKALGVMSPDYLQTLPVY